MNTWRVDHGDCLELAKSLAHGEVGAVVCDPPFGIGATRMKMGNSPCDWHKPKEHWDDETPDVSWLLGVAPLVCIWGGNYFAGQLPATADWLIWDKKFRGCSFADAELAWTNFGKRARVLNHHWSGEKKLHPCMKPLPVMRWCLSFLPPGITVLDPYCGSGSTGVACAELGFNFIGFERDAGYVEIARRRIGDAAARQEAIDDDGN